MAAGHGRRAADGGPARFLAPGAGRRRRTDRPPHRPAAAGAARDLARTPLFEVILTMQDGRTRSVEVGGATLSPQLVAAETAQYDLALDVALDASGGAIALSYASGLFDEATAAVLLDRFQG